MEINECVIYWVRRDFRLADNPALNASIISGLPILCVYILDEVESDIGEASKWWLHNSLHKFNKALDNKLIAIKASACEALIKLAKQYNAKAVYYNVTYEPAAYARDAAVAKNITCYSYNGSLLYCPYEIRTQNDDYYKVYTPFCNAVFKRIEEERFRKPSPPVTQSELQNIILLPDAHSYNIDNLGLLPKIKWYSKPSWKWEVGEEAACVKLMHFLEHGIKTYSNDRNYPALRGTSGLSPHLHFGEISPNQIFHAISKESPDSLVFKKELIWREFSYYLLYYFQNMPTHNWRSEFDALPWQTDDEAFECWKRGETGYPIVDAGMRELWDTGYMHNRVRMITASFLIKNLMIDWRLGAKWFKECLVDADIANNSAGWQWIAGSGVAAAPYFRVFNPVLQQQKFDPDFVYIKRFIGNLDKYYSDTPPIINLTTSRDKALATYKQFLKKGYG